MIRQLVRICDDVTLHRKPNALQFLHAALDQRLVPVSKDNSNRRAPGGHLINTDRSAGELGLVFFGLRTQRLAPNSIRSNRLEPRYLLQMSTPDGRVTIRLSPHS